MNQKGRKIKHERMDQLRKRREGATQMLAAKRPQKTQTKKSKSIVSPPFSSHFANFV
jgi:hypothetical protein